jgi:hypothetical protein
MAQREGINKEWALRRLRNFLLLSAATSNGEGEWRYSHPRDVVLADVQVVEKILDAVLGDWDHDQGGMWDMPWLGYRDSAVRAIAQLSQQDEVDQNMSENAPSLSASALHPWIWEACRSLWGTGHYRAAVQAAAVALNAHTQQKLSRRNESDWKLLMNAFQSKPPSPGEPRFRLMDDDGSDTFRSLHDGTGSLAQGAFRSLRNPVGHEVAREPAEYIALEQLAVFSVLARRVDDSEVVTK